MLVILKSSIGTNYGEFMRKPKVSWCLMKVDRNLENILYKVNYERTKRGLKRLSARQFTERLSRKYLYNEVLCDAEFVRF